MAIILLLWSLLFGGLGVILFTASRTAIDSIATLLCFLIATVAIAGAAIVDGLKVLRNEVQPDTRPWSDKPIPAASETGSKPNPYFK
jgi:hypothetical protein